MLYYIKAPFKYIYNQLHDFYEYEILGYCRPIKPRFRLRPDKYSQFSKWNYFKFRERDYHGWDDTLFGYNPVNFTYQYLVGRFTFENWWLRKKFWKRNYYWQCYHCFLWYRRGQIYVKNDLLADFIKRLIQYGFGTILVVSLTYIPYRYYIIKKFILDEIFKNNVIFRTFNFFKEKILFLYRFFYPWIRNVKNYISKFVKYILQFINILIDILITIYVQIEINFLIVFNYCFYYPLYYYYSFINYFNIYSHYLNIKIILYSIYLYLYLIKINYLKLKYSTFSNLKQILNYILIKLSYIEAVINIPITIIILIIKFVYNSILYKLVFERIIFIIKNFIFYLFNSNLKILFKKWNNFYFYPTYYIHFWFEYIIIFFVHLFNYIKFYHVKFHLIIIDKILRLFDPIYYKIKFYIVWISYNFLLYSELRFCSFKIFTFYYTVRDFLFDDTYLYYFLKYFAIYSFKFVIFLGCLAFFDFYAFYFWFYKMLWLKFLKPRIIAFFWKYIYEPFMWVFAPFPQPPSHRYWFLFFCYYSTYLYFEDLAGEDEEDDDEDQLISPMSIGYYDGFVHKDLFEDRNAYFCEDGIDYQVNKKIPWADKKLKMFIT